jgi:hypothetical protein
MKFFKSTKALDSLIEKANNEDVEGVLDQYELCSLDDDWNWHDLLRLNKWDGDVTISGCYIPEISMIHFYKGKPDELITKLAKDIVEAKKKRKGSPVTYLMPPSVKNSGSDD